MRHLGDDKPMWGLGELLRLSIPAGMSMLNATLMRFVDGLMVGQVGPDALSAQFYGGMSAFVPESFAMGTLTVVSTYVSQNLGAGRPRLCGQYAWAGIFLAMACALCILPLALFARPLFGLMGHAEAPLQAMYFRYMVMAVFFALTSRSVEQFFYGIHRPGVVFAASLVGNGFNVVANYVLIFGKFGFPRLGLQGAAIGTVCGWALLLAVLTAAFLSRPMHERFGTRRPLATALQQVKDVIRVGWPAGMHFANDIFCWFVFMTILVGRFGLAHRAAGATVMRYISLSFMPAIGIGIALTALVGRYIGQGRPDLAKRRTRAALLAATSYMGLCGLAFLLFRYQLVDLFVRVVSPSGLAADQAQRLNAEILRVGGYMMICAAGFQLFDATALIYIRALRGAGDTFWPMVITVVLAWGVTVGGGYLMVWLAPQWESLGPWLAASAYVILIGIFMACRFESGAWEKIDLLGRRRGPALEPVRESEI